MIWLKKIFASFSVKERRTFYASVLVGVVSGLILIWIVFVSVTVVSPANGGEYTEGSVGQPIYINPILSQTESGKNLVRLTFANLTTLADKIELDKNGKTYHVRLKENLFWSDGEKLTSDDVIFTIQELQDPQVISTYSTAWQGVSASRVSELEIQFDLSSPYAFFQQNLANLYPLPKHLFADTPLSNWRLSDYNLKPVGSGPYVVDTYDKRPDGFISAYRLKPNPYYVGTKPYIEDFTFDFFTKSEDLIKAFNSGQVDGMTGLEPANLADIHRTYDLAKYSLPVYYAVFWNQNQNPALQDDAVRNALSEAIDRDDLVSKVISGYGKPAYGPLPPDLPGISPAVQPFDPNAASGILSAAGWKMGDQGVLEKTEGKTKIELQFTLAVPDISSVVSAANYLKDQWTKLGASVSLNILSPQDILSGTIKNRDYQAVIYGNLLSGQDLSAFWRSSEKYYPGLNLALYGDKNTDKLLESIRQNPDDASRATQLETLAGSINSAHPAVFLYSPYSLFAYSRDVNGVSESFLNDFSDRLLQAPAWYVKVARNFK